jgi:hypothetical protein
VTRAELRRALTEASLLTIAEAVVEIGGRETDVRKWLRERGLIRSTEIGERVVWGDVLAVWRGELVEPPRPKRPGKLPRAGILGR